VDHDGAGKRFDCRADERPDLVALDGCGFEAGSEIQGG